MRGGHAHRSRLFVRFGVPSIGVVASAIYAGVPNDSAACSCACLATPEEELAANDLVFYGRVTDIRDVFGCGSRVIVEFEVLEGFHGAEVGERVEVSAREGGGGGDCSVAQAYAVGDELILFTDSDDPWLSLCTPSVRAPDGTYNECLSDTGYPSLSFELVLAALEAASS
jgi:hypothetical protein